MNTHRMYKSSMSVVVTILAVVLFASSAFPWGSATHAYIDNKIGSKVPLKNLNEIYGGMAADIFNFYPETLVPGSDYFNLYIQTHYNSLALWSQAQSARVSELGKASAFGFASHANGQIGSSYFGADYMAHGPGGNDLGYYVIDKAITLWGILKPQLEAAGIFLDDATGESVSHSIVEFAIDIMVAYRVPEGNGIGKKMMESVMLRTPEFPLLLVRAYGGSPDADNVIISAERDFRKTILIYGQALNQKSEGDAINAVAELLTQLANDIYGIQVPSGFVASAIMGAQELCDNDYRKEVMDTINSVRKEMAGAGIHY